MSKPKIGLRDNATSKPQEEVNTVSISKKRDIKYDNDFTMQMMNRLVETKMKLHASNSSFS
ncbi:hypothetical protein SESBI_38311 [Sesbania bispinosa]|nr:hypothetical protein SESBI_38311 [Sesbania bispinosa]